jgi:hypothetical protein
MPAPPNILKGLDPLYNPASIAHIPDGQKRTAIRIKDASPIWCRKTASVTNADGAAREQSGVSAAPAPNANGWNNSPVTVSFAGTDATSGIASCSGAITAVQQNDLQFRLGRSRKAVW